MSDPHATPNSPRNAHSHMWLMGVAGILVGSAVVNAIATSVFGAQSAVTVGLTLLYYLGVFVAVPYLLVSSRRYLLSRTEWQGVRFSFDGQGAELAPLFYKGALLTVVTLGFYGPIFTSQMYRFFVDHMRYGDRRFHYEGEGRDLMGDYVIAFFLAFVTFGLSMLWFNARRERYMLARTTVASLRFGSTVTFGRLFVLGITNVMAILLSLVPTFVAFAAVMPGRVHGRDPDLQLALVGVGLLYLVSLLFGVTVASARNFRFMVETVSVRGEIDVASIGRGGDRAADALGDQMADALDVGAGLGL